MNIDLWKYWLSSYISGVWRYNSTGLNLGLFICVCMIRVEVGENIEDNRRNLMNLTQKVFNAIVASAER